MGRKQEALISFDQNVLTLKLDKKNDISICFSNGINEKIDFSKIV